MPFRGFARALGFLVLVINDWYLAEEGTALEITEGGTVVQRFANQLTSIFAKPSFPRSGAPGAIPTRDLPLRRRTLYATELRERELVNRKQ